MMEPNNARHEHPSYKADFHIHTSYSPDSFMSPRALVEAAVRSGMSCLAITDHNTIRGALEVQSIAPFYVIIGEEISSADGEIIGLFLKEEIPRGLSARETIGEIKKQEGIVQIPHPFDRFRNKRIQRKALESVLPEVDIVEAFNARTTLRRDILKSTEFVQNNRNEFNIIPTAVTDSHTAYEIGRTWVELPMFTGREDFLEALSHGRLVGNLVTPLVHIATRFTKLTKRFIQPIPKSR